MTNVLENLNEGERWRLLVDAAKKGAEEAGYELSKQPGRGLSNVWNLKKEGEVLVTSIRTTRDRWIAFPPLQSGKKWKTLDDVEAVLVASVDDKDDPKSIEVYLFDAAEVRKRFDAAYAARIKAGQSVRDDYGMWVALDGRPALAPTSVGSGLASEHRPIAVFSISSLLDLRAPAEVGAPPTPEEVMEPQAHSLELAERPLTIADAKRRLAISLGVDPASIKITIEA